jgi:hypothetical protein
MSVDISHLVLVTLCDADDEVVDDGLDSAESSDIFAAAMVDLDRDNVFLGEREADGKVRKIFCQFAWRRTSLSATVNTNGPEHCRQGFPVAGLGVCKVSALKEKTTYLAGLLP